MTKSLELLSKEDIERLLAEDNDWHEGHLHVSINRIYADVVCPNDCEHNRVGSMGFIYCEYCSKGLDVCWEWKGCLHEFEDKRSFV